MAPQDRKLLRAWILVVATAELIGFAVPAVVGVLTAASPVAVSLPLLVAAGAVEGALLGAGQVLVLRWALPAISGRRWVVATAAAAAVAYLLALLLTGVGSLTPGWPAGVLVVLAVVVGILVLLSIGAAQWPELRRHVDHAAAWVGVIALAWLSGLTVFLAVATPLWYPGQSVAYGILVGLLAGTLMAVAMATVTGVGLVRLLRGARESGTPDVSFGPGTSAPRSSDPAVSRDEEPR